ncbi:MAG: hypothetical protein HYX63_17375 [Gammaproteobacteria bacterium]|nr:hypothetical protein [Gammaproteobacteria bacterium]
MNSYVVLLLAYAQIAATLTGFIGVVFVLGERSDGRLSAKESSAIFHLLYSALGALFLSLVAVLLLVALATNEHLAWRLANALSGVVHSAGAGRLALDARQGQAGFNRASLPAMSIGFTVMTANFVIAAGYQATVEAPVFMFATLWALGITVISFVALLMAGRPTK